MRVLAVIATFLSAAGCGASSPTVDPDAKFIGSWNGSVGTATITCTGQNPTVWPLFDTELVITKGIAAGQIVMTTMPTRIGDSACPLKFTASEDIATLDGAQQCTDISIANGNPAPAAAMVTYLAGSLETHDGAYLTVTLSGSLPDAVMADHVCTYASLSAASKMQ